MIHVDTSFLVDLMREQARQTLGAATVFLTDHAHDQLAASVFVVCELEAGAARAARPDRERARVRGLLQAVTVSYLDERFAPVYADRRARIQKTGRSISPMDLLIATSAIVDDAELVTGNRRHFDAVPDLRLLTYR